MERMLFRHWLHSHVGVCAPIASAHASAVHDARFIAEARTAVPALCLEVRRLQKLVSERVLVVG